jgi:hypothetical protein
MKHQNGEILFPYDAMPQIFADGARSGISTLFMFGWWPGGMDRMYPDYVPDPKLGGGQSMRENIRRFQEGGGNVIMYSSGRLVDRETDWFKEHGHLAVIKTRSGAEVRDNYLFSNRSTFERCYGSVELSPMCLGAREWIKVLRSVVDMAADYGCKGVFFDQLGSQEYPCCDPEHGHPVPYLNQTDSKRQVLAELRAYARERNPDMAFGIEIFSDATAQYCDFVHGLYLQTLFAQENWEENQEKPRHSCFVDWMRYVYPDLTISDRDIRDDTDIERRVNWALQRGLIHDVEIYRCRKTIAETPHYQDYLGKINQLRERNHDLLRLGTYRDTLGFDWSESEAEARAFVNGERMAVVVCQSHKPSVTGTLTVPGYRYTGSDSVGNVTVNGTGAQPQVTLGKHGLAVLIFERTTG